MTWAVQKPLFGAERGWSAADWTASDDRVRGGKSQSYLKIHDEETATFCGHLDIDTLGGAGFASQRTTGDDRHWDLSKYSVAELLIDPAKSDGKRYTFILKDETLPRNPENGREQSTVSWEFEFDVSKGHPHHEHVHLTSVVVPWDMLKATYRGKEVDPGRSINLSDIRRISIMMRSYFGEQKGDFSLCIVSIAAGNRNGGPGQRILDETAEASDDGSIRKPNPLEPWTEQSESRSIWTKLLSLCNKL